MDRPCLALSTMLASLAGVFLAVGSARSQVSWEVGRFGASRYDVCALMHDELGAYGYSPVRDNLGGGWVHCRTWGAPHNVQQNAVDVEVDVDFWDEHALHLALRELPRSEPAMQVGVEPALDSSLLSGHDEVYDQAVYGVGHSADAVAAANSPLPPADDAPPTQQVRQHDEYEYDYYDYYGYDYDEQYDYEALAAEPNAVADNGPEVRSRDADQFGFDGYEPYVRRSWTANNAASDAPSVVDPSQLSGQASRQAPENIAPTDQYGGEPYDYDYDYGDYYYEAYGDASGCEYEAQHCRDSGLCGITAAAPAMVDSEPCPIAAWFGADAGSQTLVHDSLRVIGSAWASLSPIQWCLQGADQAQAAIRRYAAADIPQPIAAASGVWALDDSYGECGLAADDCFRWGECGGWYASRVATRPSVEGRPAARTLTADVEREREVLLSAARILSRLGEGLLLSSDRLAAMAGEPGEVRQVRAATETPIR